MSVTTTIPSGKAGLDRLGQAASQFGLGYLWKQFESKLPELFIDDVTESKVGVAVAEKDHDPQPPQFVEEDKYHY
ncbi:hypothetical protein Hte_012095 [Hypoxylon texense]